MRLGDLALLSRSRVVAARIVLLVYQPLCLDRLPLGLTSTSPHLPNTADFAKFCRPVAI